MEDYLKFPMIMSSKMVEMQNFKLDQGWEETL
jgi:hypothetical protein